MINDLITCSTVYLSMILSHVVQFIDINDLITSHVVQFIYQ